MAALLVIEGNPGWRAAHGTPNHYANKAKLSINAAEIAGETLYCLRPSTLSLPRMRLRACFGQRS